jgi:hypothetical protein
MQLGEYSHLLWQIRRRRAQHLWKDCWRVTLPGSNRTLQVRATRWRLITILPKGLAAAGPLVGMPTTGGGPTTSACPTGECRYMMLLAAIAASSLLAFGFLLFVVQLVAHEIGFWIGRRRAGGGNIASEGVGVLVTGTGRRMPPRRLS